MSTVEQDYADLLKRWLESQRALKPGEVQKALDGADTIIRLFNERDAALAQLAEVRRVLDDEMLESLGREAIIKERTALLVRLMGGSPLTVAEIARCQMLELNRLAIDCKSMQKELDTVHEYDCGAGVRLVHDYDGVLERKGWWFSCWPWKPKPAVVEALWALPAWNTAEEAFAVLDEWRSRQTVPKEMP